MSRIFHESAFERLQTFLNRHEQPAEALPLTPDASTREFYRISYKNLSAIACLYPESFDERSHPYIDVTNLFAAGGLPVAELFAVEGSLGVIVMEDFGDTILRNVLLATDFDSRQKLINDSIALIARIQAATGKAFDLDSIASKLKFDEEKLLWELIFFKTHYFESFLKTSLSDAEDAALTEEFTKLSRELEARAEVLCHRDFHAANLMLDSAGDLRIIDHQDARIGSVAYDLVSLLLDRINEPPDEAWLDEKKWYFLRQREALGMEKIDRADFDYEFDLMTVQRCLKAIGTFSNQAANFGKTHYNQYIEPMFQVVLRAAVKLDEFPILQQIIKRSVSLQSVL